MFLFLVERINCFNQFELYYLKILLFLVEKLFMILWYYRFILQYKNYLFNNNISIVWFFFKNLFMIQIFEIIMLLREFIYVVFYVNCIMDLVLYYFYVFVLVKILEVDVKGFI